METRKKRLKRPVKNARARVPGCTYRLQFSRHFTFRQARELVDYLSELGVTDCYFSPFLKAVPGSIHGYDVTDHNSFNPEVGSEEDFTALARALRERNISILMDVVPNHMAIGGSANSWWTDVLENGPSSPYSRYFDIDWSPPKPDLADKVLLPILGNQYGKALENQEIQVRYLEGSFFADTHETSLPVTPKSWILILEPVLENLKSLPQPAQEAVELESILTALRHLPPRTEREPSKVEERIREKEIIKKRLRTLTEQSPLVIGAVEEELKGLNGRKGDARSFDRLEKLMEDQVYRLSYWKVAADEINYRRFFDVNHLAAIRVEEPEVFKAVHELPLRLAAAGLVSGFRIDHVDGLFDPKQYLQDLREALGKEGRDSFYIAAEKILLGKERLRKDWPVQGTTGYDYLNLLNAFFLDRRAGRFSDIYGRFTRQPRDFKDVLVVSKKFIMLVSMSSELQMLATRLDRISEQHRWSRDFTLETLRFGLREVMACFPVYRSYVRPGEPVGSEDRKNILSAAEEAKRRNPATDVSLFDFIASVLLMRHPEGLGEAEISQRREFVMRFQQITPPVTAKGMEDTAFYRYHPLASLNEVGGNPEPSPVSVREFHSENKKRFSFRPHSLLATTTHDTKRSEDVRARINALSEIPARWYRALLKWRKLNENLKTKVRGKEAPGPNEEYLLYQTLIGTWPLSPMSRKERAEYLLRIKGYMLKAMREAKVQTSWIRPNRAYEEASLRFIERILKPEENAFLPGFLEFQRPVAKAGMLNSLSQVLLKTASPGVPDFYQGTELWDFSLVDPDNRRPVDFSLRKKLLSSLASGNAQAALKPLLKSPEDSRIKLYLTWKCLDLRRRHQELFLKGDYLPLEAKGGQKDRLCSFARRHGKKTVIAAAGRFFMGLEGDWPFCGKKSWKDTLVIVGEKAPGNFRDVLTGRTFRAQGRSGSLFIPVSELFSELPAALLESLP